MTKPKVIITRKWPEAAEAKAKELFDVILNEDDHKMSVDELKDAMRNADAVCPTVSDFQINSDIFAVEDRRCKIVANFGVGFNNIDTDAAKEAGVVVSNTPEVLTDCTADIAMVLLLSVARRIGEGERLLRNKEWTGWCPTHMLATKVTGKKLGFIGFGRIAQAVAQKAHFGFGMQLSFYDPYPPSDEVIKKFSATKMESVEDVLKDADFVTLHCPGGGSNTNLMNAERFGLMKNSAFLINTARGDVVDEAALVQALKEGAIAGAGLDVFAKEPNVTEDLLSMENVVLLPHLGSATTETRVAMGLRSLANVEAFFKGQEPGDRVA
ncbi:MAG: D-glycerate dehydrogenase [Proteobacteria bacterium]|nr:D-glycerate dehydrogenase [Pseudomonadota bacterium]